MTKIVAVAGKGGVGKTSLAGAFVKVLVEKYPDKKILAIDADPAVGLSTVLNIEVDKTIDDIRKEVIKNVEDGDTKSAVELLGEAKYEIYDAIKEQDGYAFIAIGRPETAGCYCRINSYLKEVITLLSEQFDYVVIELVMYEKAGVIVNRIPDKKVIELMDISGLPLLSVIENDMKLAEADIKGENILTLSDDDRIVAGAAEALCNIGLI